MDQHAVAAAIGARIRRARVANSLTLVALAERAGLSEAFLSRVERGKAQSSIANLVQICAILGLGLQDLLAGHGQSAKTITSVYRSGAADQH
ncbi:MAG: helix-turn-helix domain-containing protein, partial [Candidatus Binataceae bacterium]